MAASLLATLAASGQTGGGELRLSIADATGAALEASGELAGEAGQLDLHFVTDASGQYTARHLPFGTYELTLRRTGFASRTLQVEILSELPVQLSVQLQLAPLQASVEVRANGTPVDPSRISSVPELGQETLRERPASSPGRGLVDLIQAQPGWIVEAGGVLHPRGSEYDTQYVVDGLPFTDNRSPAFAPALQADDLESVNIITAGIPAEYGRKLGGVIEATTAAIAPQGFHLAGEAEGGSFASEGGYLGGSYTFGKNGLSLSGWGSQTDRYLDPPVTANYTNSGTLAGGRATFTRDFSSRDRLELSANQGRASFLVPNDLCQQFPAQDDLCLPTPGQPQIFPQRESRATRETSGQLSFQHIFSPDWLARIQVRERDLSAGLVSNPSSVPIEPQQHRGLRDTFASGSVSAHHGRHEMKFGADAEFGDVTENFSYQITRTTLDGQPIFDPSTPLAFSFSGGHADREQSAFAQDLIRMGRLTISAGVRWDHYRLLVDENAASPRLGAAWYWPGQQMVFRASYDRIFQTPAVENLLLASSAQVRTLNASTAQLKVRPAQGNYYGAGFSKGFFGHVEWTGDWFLRRMRNFADNDTLLDTGVDFPIAFTSASIYGAETRLTLPRWGRFSGFVNESYMVGHAQLPVAGGLFLGDDAANLLNSTQQIRVTQDQRHTSHARIRFQAAGRLWLALAGSYGSGLPVETNSGTPVAALVQEFGANVVGKVNFARSQARPSFSLDAAAGLEILRRGDRAIELQAGVQNFTDQLNLINFASVFSGTALASPRAFSLRLRAQY